MARGKFNFLNIKKLTPEELATLKAACPVWLELGEEVYANHSGEWFARKTNKYTYTIVSYERLTTEGWRAEGLAGRLKGVREVVETLHKEREAKRKANWMWC